MPNATQTAPQTGGTGNGTANQQATVMPGDLFGVPKYGTQRRFVQDGGNASLAATPLGNSQVNIPTTKLDQLDIVSGWKMACQFGGTWTNTGTGLRTSPLFPANVIQQITVQLQAAYSSFRMPGFMAAALQALRPMWGSNQLGPNNPDVFAAFKANTLTYATPYTGDFNIDIPVAWKFDEYFNLNATGDPVGRKYDQFVTPYAMASQARVVVPTITLNPQLPTGNLLSGPVSRASDDTTSTFTAGSFAAQINREAWFASNSPAANPPMYPWLYTRDYFTQPTAGQAQVGALIQNTGISVGQVLGLWFMVWDPEADSGLGAIVPSSDIVSIELVTGGTLQNYYYTPQQLQDRMRTMYGAAGTPYQEGQLLDGAGFLDFAMDDSGSYYSNANAINTYLVNGVQLNLTFANGSVPSAASTVYIGVEALKLATS